MSRHSNDSCFGPPWGGYIKTEFCFFTTVTLYFQEALCGLGGRHNVSLENRGFKPEYIFKTIAKVTLCQSLVTILLKLPQSFILG